MLERHIERSHGRSGSPRNAFAILKFGSPSAPRPAGFGHGQADAVARAPPSGTCTPPHRPVTARKECRHFAPSVLRCGAPRPDHRRCSTPRGRLSAAASRRGHPVLDAAASEACESWRAPSAPAGEGAPGSPGSWVGAVGVETRGDTASRTVPRRARPKGEWAVRRGTAPIGRRRSRGSSGEILLACGSCSSEASAGEAARRARPGDFGHHRGHRTPP